MYMREFITSAEAAGDEGDTYGSDLTIKVDGREVKIMPVNEGAMAMLLASDAAPLHQKVSATINFFFSILRDGRDIEFFKSRLYDRGDPFNTEHVTDIVESVIEEWSGDPTQSPSDSTGSPPTTGESSTGSALRKASTRSSSRRTASAT
jgi:hypothetical protein